MVNNENTVIKLPFWETIRRSFLYPFTHVEAVTKITSIWFIILFYEMLTGFPGVCDVSSENCQGVAQLGSTILMMMASVSIVVAFSRYVIIKEEPQMFQFRFGKREFKYIGFSLLIGFFIFVPSLLILGAIVGLAKIFSGSSFLAGFFALIGLAISLTILIIGTRLYLKLAAVSVDNSSIDLKEIFELTKGNSNRFFWGQVVLAIPYGIITVLVSVIFNLLGDFFIAKTLFTICILIVAYFYSCITASYYAHAYQYFMYFADKKPAPAKEVSIAKEETKESKAPSKKAPSKKNPAKAKAKVEPKTKAVVKSKPKAVTKPKAEPKAKPKAKTAPKAKAEPKTKTK